MLRKSFIMTELTDGKRLPAFMKNPRFFGYYPERVTEVLEDLFVVGEEPRGRLGKRARGWMRRFNVYTALRDLWGLMRL
jgi:hypothetical protein